MVGQNPPIPFSSIKQDYHQITRDIRRTVIAQAQQRGWGKRRQSTTSIALRARVKGKGKAGDEVVSRLKNVLT